MQHYLLYIAAPSQIATTLAIFAKMEAKQVPGKTGLGDCYRIEHTLLEGHIFNVYIANDLDTITAHLRVHPIDLLIYDERGPDAMDALDAIRKISDDVKNFAKLWGPDFEFPISRTVCILNDINNMPMKPFMLGRYQVRNVIINPTQTTTVLSWLKDVLTHGLIATKNPVGIALSGGGIEGLLYQVGCLYALDIAMHNKRMHDCEVFSGVSSGSICASVLANKIPLKEIIKAVRRESEILPDVKPGMFYDIAARKIVERLVRESLRWDGLSPKAWANKILRAIPTGFFKGDEARNYFEEAINRFGGKSKFSELDCKLYIGATDQDSFEHVVFGTKDWLDIPITAALRASCALPPFFTPMQINGRHFVDGQITGSCNLNEVVKSGCRLIFIIDPLKPYSTHIPGTVDQFGGIFSIIQIIKALVYSRFRLTLEHVTERYPDIEFLVFQPDEECAEAMAGSPMKYNIRTEIIDLAIQGTLRRLRMRHPVYSARLEKYGFILKTPKELLRLEKGDYELL